MRIGIDAKWYFEGPPSGRRVVKSLVDHLLSLDKENEYFIFLNEKHKNRPFPGQREKVNLCYVWAGNNMLSNVFVLPGQAKRLRLDVVLYQNFVTPFGTTKKVAYIHDVLFLSNPEYYTFIERLYFSPLKFLTRRSDAIITVSEEEKKRLIRYKFASGPEKITVAYHGVDQSFKPLSEYGPAYVGEVKRKFELPERYLLFVGRLNLRKNVDNLLRAVPELKDKTTPLLIVGAENWKKSNHARIAEELGIADRVVFKGAIYDDLGVVYALSTVFCFPSYAESFGLPPLEAMASGIPVVVSDTTSLPEICGEAGSYVRPDQPAEIASAIDKLLSNQELYEEKQRLGLARAKKFTWNNAAQIVLNCMKSC